MKTRVCARSVCVQEVTVRTRVVSAIILFYMQKDYDCGVGGDCLRAAEASYYAGIERARLTGTSHAATKRAMNVRRSFSLP
jgi:hypothetical protein